MSQRAVTRLVAIGAAAALGAGSGAVLLSVPDATAANPAFTTSATNAVLGKPIHDTASINGDSGGGATVIFTLYGAGDATCAAAAVYTSPAVAVAGGKAVSPDFVPSAAGSYQWIAKYSSSAEFPYSPGSCGDFGETSTVQYKSAISTTSASPVPVDTAIHDTATLSAVSGAPTGTVTFDLFDDAACATAPLHAFTSPDLAGKTSVDSDAFAPPGPGTYYWTAAYSGDATNAPVTSPCGEPVTVTAGGGAPPPAPGGPTYTPTPAATSLSLASAPNASNAGDVVSFTARVTSTVQGTPTGTVTFKEGTLPLGSAPLGGQLATLNLSNLSVGVHDVVATYSGDQTFAPSTSNHVSQVVVQPPPPEPFPRPSCLPGNQVMVCAAYQDLLHRFPDQGALDGWSARIDSGNLTRGQVMAAITGSTEYQQKLVASMYVAYLGRDADPGGSAFVVNLLKAGVTDEAVRAGLLGSAEAYAVDGGTPTGVINALYKELLGRPADPAGQAFALGELAAGGTPNDLAAAILGSPEYRSRLITGWYQAFLRRSVDPGGLNAQIAGLAAGVTDEQIIDALVGSDEYFTKAQSR